MKLVALMLAIGLMVSGCAAQPPEKRDVTENKTAISQDCDGKLYGEVVACMGPPESEEDFVMSWGELEFRIELRNFFDRKSIEAGDVTLRESTWSLEGAENLTIWFHKVGEAWRRIHSRHWHDDDLF